MIKLEKLIKVLNLEEREERDYETSKLVIELMAEVKDYNLTQELLKNLIETNVKTTLELAEKLEIIKKLSETDQLTQSFNRHKFIDTLSYEIKKFQRSGEPLCIIMFDIDHFKSVNDNYGHDVGDHVLKEISSLIKDNLRSYDTFARWGGEEFMILMPGMTLEHCESKAEQLRMLVANHDFIEDRVITSSFGVTEFSANDTEETFTKRVDQALYDSKETGRNRVTVLS